jgi:hypothetical protein
MPPEFVKGASKSHIRNEAPLNVLFGPNRKPVLDEGKMLLRLVYVAPANVVPAVVVTITALYLFVAAS